jgi:hypothetical protein
VAWAPTSLTSSSFNYSFFLPSREPMSRGAIENLVPESSTTPTISSISSEISFEDVQSVAEMDSIDPKAKHPTLYEHDGMVTFKA